MVYFRVHVDRVTAAMGHIVIKEFSNCLQLNASDITSDDNVFPSRKVECKFIHNWGYQVQNITYDLSFDYHQ